MGLTAEGSRPEGRPGRRDLSRESFEALLSALGPDRDRAGETYEAIRARLLRFFTWRGAHGCEDLTDDTFDRVSRRLAQGETIHAGDVGRYFLGVARNVLREDWERERRRRTVEVTDHRVTQPTTAPPHPPDAREVALACLDRCLEALPPETRDVVIAYYDLQGGELMRQRRALAARLGIASNALRLRLHRLRHRLEDCVQHCLERRDTPAPAGPPRSEEGGE